MAGQAQVAGAAWSLDFHLGPPWYTETVYSLVLQLRAEGSSLG